MDCACIGYDLPNAVYVDNTIAAGMSYGYIPALQPEDPNYQHTYLFVIAYESCMTMSIVRYTKKEMKLIYTTSEECPQRPSLCVKLVKRFLKKSNSDYEKEILENKVLRAKAIQSMESSMNYLCSLQENDTLSIKMDFLNDGNEEMKYKEIDSLSGKDIQEDLIIHYEDVVNKLTGRFTEVSENKDELF